MPAISRMNLNPTHDEELFPGRHFSCTVNNSACVSGAPYQAKETLSETANLMTLRDALLDKLPDDYDECARALKGALVELAKRSNSCILCRYLKQKPSASRHSIEDCRLSKALSAPGENWEHAIVSGQAGTRILRYLNKSNPREGPNRVEKPRVHDNRVSKPYERPSRVQVNLVQDKRVHESVEKFLSDMEPTIKPTSDIKILRDVALYDDELRKARGIAWLMDTGCESIAGATSHAKFLVNIRPASATVNFDGRLHESTQMGDIPLGNNEFVRGVHILPLLSPFVNILNPTKIICSKKRELFWTRDERELIATAGTKLAPRKYRVITKSTLSYIVLPTLADPKFNLEDLWQKQKTQGLITNN